MLTDPPARPLNLRDGREAVSLNWDMLYAYCGPSQIIATALCYRLFEQAFRELSPAAAPAREDLSLLTAFPGRGVLECVELITRIPSLRSGRLELDTRTLRPGAAPSLEGCFYFEVQNASKRRSYTAAPEYFDKEFLHMVGMWQNREMNRQEYERYMAYKTAKGEALLKHKGDLFRSAEIPARKYEPAQEICEWYGLSAYGKQ